MSLITLKANESKILLEAAENGGRVIIPTRLKEVTRQRMAGLFAQHGLTELVDDVLQLTRAGYRAVGLRPPRARPTSAGSGETRVSMRHVVRDLLQREEGATLAELIDATGWLPHTTRASLSRLRSSGDALAKAKRDDGATCYRLLPAGNAVSKRSSAEQGAEAVVEIAA